MGKYGLEVVRAAKVVGVLATLLTEDDAKVIHNRICCIVPTSRTSIFIWDGFKESKSIRGPTCWWCIDEWIGDKECILFFSELEDRMVFALPNGAGLVEVLKKCNFTFEWYVTDRNFEYILCFNHEQFLIATGSASQWLESRFSLE